MNIHKYFILAVISLATYFTGHGQLEISATGTYSQDFNSLLSTGSVNDFIDNSTIPNWYSQRTGSNISYAANNGSSLTGNLYSYGTTGSPERALGSIGSSNTASGGDFANGILFQNVSGLLVTNFTISYTLEQWRKSNVTEPQVVTFWYKVSSTAISDLEPGANGTWVAVTALDAASAVNDGTAAAAVDGNTATYQTLVSNVSIAGLNLIPGQFLMLKWDDVDHAGSDHGLAIDDVTISWETTTNCESSSEITISSCEEYTLNAETFTESGAYTQVLQNALGCDSTITLNLTILNATSSNQTLEECGALTVNGETYTSSGVYVQTFENAAGCDSLVTYNVTIHPIPTANAVLADEVTITASPINQSYQWINCATNSPVTGATSITFNPTVNGSYSVIVTSNEGCADTSACVTVSTLTTQEKLSESKPSVYPNPTKGKLSVSAASSEQLQITIFNALGKVIYTSSNLSNGSVIDIGSAQSGVYMIQIQSSKGTVVQRVVKN
jgi:hypothetical protein